MPRGRPRKVVAEAEDVDLEQEVVPVRVHESRVYTRMEPIEEPVEAADETDLSAPEDPLAGIDMDDQDYFQVWRMPDYSVTGKASMVVPANAKQFCGDYPWMPDLMHFLREKLGPGTYKISQRGPDSHGRIIWKKHVRVIFGGGAQHQASGASPSFNPVFNLPSGQPQQQVERIDPIKAVKDQIALLREVQGLLPQPAPARDNGSEPSLFAMPGMSSALEAAFKTDPKLALEAVRTVFGGGEKESRGWGAVGEVLAPMLPQLLPGAIALLMQLVSAVTGKPSAVPAQVAAQPAQQLPEALPIAERVYLDLVNVMGSSIERGIPPESFISLLDSAYGYPELVPRLNGLVSGDPAAIVNMLAGGFPNMPHLQHATAWVAQMQGLWRESDREPPQEFYKDREVEEDTDEQPPAA